MRIFVKLVGGLSLVGGAVAVEYYWLGGSLKSCILMGLVVASGFVWGLVSNRKG